MNASYRKTISAESLIRYSVGTAEEVPARVAPRKSWKESQSPYPWLRACLLLAIIGFVVTGIVLPGVFPKANSDTTSRVSALFIALVGLFTGTIVYMGIYDYVNVRNQIRQWRFEYALRRVQDIYAPLWDQTRGLINAIQNFDGTDNWIYRSQVVGQSEKSVGFRQLQESHLGLFLDSRARHLLQDFHKSVEEYDKAHSLAWNQLYKSVSQEVAKLTGDPTYSGGSGEMLNTFVQYPRMAYDPTPDETEMDARERFIVGHSKLFHDQGKALSDFDAVLGRLRNLEEVRKLRHERKVSLPKGEAVLVRLREIIEDPMSVVLDFERQ